MLYLGIEIGGTKLQLGLGSGDGTLASLWRGNIQPADGSAGIRRQIAQAVPELLAKAGVAANQIVAAGVGFGGPVDAVTQTVIRSHQIDGWDNFPLAAWITDLLHMPVVIGNDADLAGLGEAIHGAGKDISPMFYITIGSGIGGGLIIDQKVYPGAGRGAAEIGHVAITQCDHGQYQTQILEHWASGWAIQGYVRQQLRRANPPASTVLGLAGGDIDRITAQHVAQAAGQGDALAIAALDRATSAVSQAICHVIALLCPRRIIIGGGVSLMGEALFFQPLRAKVARDVYKPFAGLTEILPAALGEQVVVHGAIALARQTAGATEMAGGHDTKRK